MEKIRICVIYSPWLYTDIFQQLFRKLDRINIIENYYHDLHPQIRRKPVWDQADVLILSLDSRDALELDLLTGHMPHALLVAFSPHGEYSLQRRPNECHWEVVRPFGFEQLLQLVKESDKILLHASIQLPARENVKDAAG